MPIIRVQMWEGRSLDQKRRLVRELTDSLARIIDCEKAHIRVVIDEYSRENWAAGGILEADSAAARRAESGSPAS